MHNLFCENDFYLHENKKSFSFQRLSTEPHFDKKTPGELGNGPLVETNFQQTEAPIPRSGQ